MPLPTSKNIYFSHVLSIFQKNLPKGVTNPLITKESIPNSVFKKWGRLAYLEDIANGDNRFPHITVLQLNYVY